MQNKPSMSRKLFLAKLNAAGIVVGNYGLATSYFVKPSDESVDVEVAVEQDNSVPLVSNYTSKFIYCTEQEFIDYTKQSGSRSNYLKNSAISVKFNLSTMNLPLPKRTLKMEKFILRLNFYSHGRINGDLVLYHGQKTLGTKWLNKAHILNDELEIDITLSNNCGTGANGGTRFLSGRANRCSVGTQLIGLSGATPYSTAITIGDFFVRHKSTP